MPVSSNTLFHFTNSIGNVFNILTNDFIPHYCLEKFKLNNKIFEAAFPFVSFCDIPLAQVKEHLNIYGSYGIGLKRDWGYSNRLNSVLYIENNSTFADYSYNLFQNIAGGKDKNHSVFAEFALKMVSLLKPFEGDYKKGGKTFNSYRFYNEREWRFTPEGFYMMLKNDFNDNTIREHANEGVASKKLLFQPNDISYIIIRDENEIEGMIESLKFIKSPKYDDRTIDKLISRIITVERIQEDF